MDLTEFPDPKNREAFHRFIDRCPVGSASTDSLAVEAGHWGRVSNDQRSIEGLPSGNALLSAIGSISKWIGVICTFLGALGFASRGPSVQIAAVATVGGIAATILGWLLAAWNSPAINAEMEARLLVNGRLLAIIYELERRGGQPSLSSDLKIISLAKRLSFEKHEIWPEASEKQER